MNKEDPGSEKKEIEAILRDQKVRKALELSSPEPSLKADKKNNKSLKVGFIIFLILSCLIIIYLLKIGYFHISEANSSIFNKVIVITVLCSTAIFINRVVRRTIGRKIEDKSLGYNFTKIVNLFTIAVIGLIVLTSLFANWYATMVSFGIVSLVLGLALQNTFTSFFGWVYLLIRKPYEVGDRIKIGSAYGDVIRVGYFDTTLWEFGGDYLSGDHPSGRLIKFANSKVFSEYIYNYSWPLFPFIWNELKFYVTYESDFHFVTARIQQFAEAEVGEAMERRVKRYKKILTDFLVEEIEVRERPSVFLRAHENTWIEVTVRFLVEPKNSGRVKTKLFQDIMEDLKKYPDSVSFPNTNL